MLKTILAISGKPGLYKFVSRGNKMLIVETIDDMHKRMPAHSTDRVVALSDISIYTNDDSEVPLATVFQNIQKEYDNQAVTLSPKKASQEEIVAFFTKALPTYDSDRVRVSDMRKVLAWYNLLVGAGLTDFTIQGDEQEAPETEEKDA